MAGGAEWNFEHEKNKLIRTQILPRYLLWKWNPRKDGRWWRRWKSENLFWRLYPSGLRWGWVGWGWEPGRKWQKKAKMGESGVFVGHIPAVSQEAISTASSDWEGTEEGMKIEGRYLKKNKKKLVFHIPLALRFHGNRFHNTVAFESACGAACVFLTRLWPHKRKPIGATERKKSVGKKRRCRGR